MATLLCVLVSLFFACFLTPACTHTRTHTFPLHHTVDLLLSLSSLGFLSCPALPLSVLCKSAMFDEPALSTWDQYQVVIWPALANKGRASYPPSGREREREKDTHTDTHTLAITALITLARKTHSSSNRTEHSVFST